MRPWISLVGLVVVVGACNDEPEKIVPETRSRRGESCLARNDCADGLACVMGVCSQNDFDIDVSARHCERVECEADVDCCGSKPLQAPARCANRVAVCETPQVEDCSFTSCTDDGDCGDGTCGSGYCSQTSTLCSADADCETDTCDTSLGYCSLSYVTCTTDDDCLENPCVSRTCDCSNPEYDPTDDICTDSECTDVCVYKCEDRLCVHDTSCESDMDCLGLTADICDSGRCVECLEKSDCDSEDEECVDGSCERPCDADEECPLFHQCQDGECVETGCTSDRECVLAANSGSGDWSGDPRRAQCLVTGQDPDVKYCRVPCENDAECIDPIYDVAQGVIGPRFQVCDTDGFCKFIGCTSDAECRAYLGLENQTPTDDRPFVATAVCSKE